MDVNAMGLVGQIIAGLWYAVHTGHASWHWRRRHVIVRHAKNFEYAQDLGVIE